ncbi:transcription factor S-II, central domain-containing protein [Cryomyces antarcticus]|uniref:Transcription elongation factor n=1 Tax=Cryomyces antarcticus TaxID=329879 RepID=A0ABR0M8T3_9PEZI|nr:transcription elongation factor TFIIS [Cryomyces antarcticus]KAK5141293.1 hypothetical protein LTR04_002664 [Oleoguttula sp. CCFEE 6159]KAK5295679.1 transcription elongation factor TFIIS [Cryomyces antarcticus]
MDAKDIEELGKALSKAIVGGDSPASLLSLLEKLRKGVKITEKLLRQTKIGMTVNKLKQHKDPAVARQAGDLVSKWRTDINNAKSAAVRASSSNGTASPASTPSQSALPKQPKVKHDVAPDKRNTKTDKVDTNVTGNATRDNCLKLMYDGLAHMSEEPPDDILRIARAVEVAAYNAYQPETSEAYKSKMRSLYQNLKNKSNPGLRTHVLNGDIAPARFVVMTHEELRSPQQRAEDARLQKENMDKAMVAQEEKSISASLTCGKCGQKKVSYSQAQTRSADEPMTTFCECTICGNRWKFS